MSEKLKDAAADSEYAAVAEASGRIVAVAVQVCVDQYPEEPEAVLAGVIGALVSLTVEQIRERGEVATVRDVNTALIRGINRMAEQIVRNQIGRVDLPA